MYTNDNGNYEVIGDVHSEVSKLEGNPLFLMEFGRRIHALC